MIENVVFTTKNGVEEAEASPDVTTPRDHDLTTAIMQLRKDTLSNELDTVTERKQKRFRQPKQYKTGSIFGIEGSVSDWTTRSQDKAYLA